MSEPFFKESDCDIFHTTPVISIKAANQLLRERGTVVYGIDEDASGWMFSQKQCRDGWDTHRALLIAIKPIAKDSAEKILADWTAHLEKRKEAKDFFYNDELQFLDRAKKLRGEK